MSLPAAYWPAHWHGKYRRPVVLLELSLYGHSKASDRWDQRMCYCTGEAGFVKAPEWPSVFKHSVSKAALGVYVDDFEMASPPSKTAELWKALELNIEFGKPQHVRDKEPTRHLGCYYSVLRETTENGHVITHIEASMEAYCEDIVKRFEERMHVMIKPYKTPWLDSSAHKTYAQEKEEVGIYADIASSPLMSVLYSARAAKPDQIVATLRLARQVHRWTKIDDRRLIRLLGSIRESASEKLRGALSTEDEGSAVLRFWPDADLAGDPETDSKSTSGRWVELASTVSDRSMGLAWNGRKQTFTADSTVHASGSMHDWIGWSCYWAWLGWWRIINHDHEVNEAL